jgi:hypothetical protein
MKLQKISFNYTTLLPFFDFLRITKHLLDKSIRIIFFRLCSKYANLNCVSIH